MGLFSSKEPVYHQEVYRSSWSGWSEEALRHNAILREQDELLERREQERMRLNQARAREQEKIRQMREQERIMQSREEKRILQRKQEIAWRKQQEFMQWEKLLTLRKDTQLRDSEITDRMIALQIRQKDDERRRQEGIRTRHKVTRNPLLIKDLRRAFGLPFMLNFPETPYTEQTLPKNSPEFNEALEIFMETNRPMFTVNKIIKVDNPFLILSYSLTMRRCEDTRNEECFDDILFHGTKSEYLHSICSFNLTKSKLQINLQASQPQQQSINDSNGTSPSPLEDDIDAALNNLQTTLEGSSISTHINDITSVPELKDQLRFLKPKRFTLKAYKKYWFTCRDLHLYMYKNREDMVHNINCVMNINLKGCEVTPDVNISQNKYVIKLEVPSADGMSEMYIRCDDETQYSRWMACCRLAAKGRSLADSSYETEKQTILDFLNLQRRAEEPVINPSTLDIQVEDYIAPKYLKKSKWKITQRILEAHTNVKDLSLVGAKMNYIKAWQLLPDFGITLFAVKFMDCKKEELLGVAYNRIMKMDISSGDHQKTWRFNTMKAWNVNWEIKHMMVQFEEGNIVFSCLSADCKVVHEFIGGYIFLSTRSKDASQTLNEELFHKLTGGWS